MRTCAPCLHAWLNLQLPKPSVFKLWQIFMDLWNDSAKRHGLLKARACLGCIRSSV